MHYPFFCIFRYFHFFFFFNDTATTEIYTLSLHDALPISLEELAALTGAHRGRLRIGSASAMVSADPLPQILRERSEEHTSELQSRQYLVCRLLLEKKKTLKSNFFSYKNDVVLPPISYSNY